MHLTIVALGSRGDVQPFIALGVGLRKAGYEVRVASYRIFTSLVERHGLEFAPIEGEPRSLLEEQSGQKWMESGKNFGKFFGRFRGLFTSEDLQSVYNDVLEACRGTRAILYSPLGASAYHVAEMMNVPRLYVLLQPFSRTRQFPSFAAPALPLGGSYNWLTHLMAEQVLWQMFRTSINRWRRESLHLDPVPFKGPFNLLYRNQQPFVYGFSSHVVPRPPDWPAWHYVTGYWFLEEAHAWSPPADLLRFLSAGSKPIYLGFGSMSGRAARELADLSIRAVTQSQQRAVLLGGWAAAQELELPDTIYALESAPHDWLFPQMAAVVHHGGAGTTAAGLRAGRPTMIVPFFGDQPYWGQRVYALGAGPKPIMRANLTVEQLAQAITQAITDRSIQHAAAALGEQIRAEDGVARAVEVISQYLRPAASGKESQALKIDSA